MAHPQIVKWKKYSKWIACLLATFMLSTTALAADLYKMTIATGVDPSLSAFYIGQTQGIFKRNGLDVQLKTGSSGSAMVPFLIQNQIQSAFSAEQAGVQSFAIDSDVVLVAEGTSMSEFYGVMGRNINSLEELKGKRVGVSKGSASEVFWNAMLKKLNLNASDYKVIQVEPPEMVAALERGNIDAFVAWDPWNTRAMNISGVKLVRGQEGIMDPRIYLFMNKKWVLENPEAALRFMKSMIEATKFINGNPKQAAEDVAKFLKLDLPLTEMLIRKFSFEMRLSQQSVSNVMAVAEQLKASGKLNKEIDWNMFVYGDLLRKIDPSKVNYTIPK